MIELENWLTKAFQKLDAEQKAVSGQKEKVMAPAVLAAIKDFCKQEPEFAQAVVQGGTFAKCMKKIAAGTGNTISDLDAYKKAVEFYFPGAKVQMALTIDLIGDAAGEPEPKAQPAQVAEPPKSTMTLNLADFF